MTRRSDKERATDVPSWAKGKVAMAGESPKEAASRLLREHYGHNDFPRGPGSEFNKLEKHFERR